MSVTIGVDIGGSHISCAALNTKTFEPIPGSLVTGKVNSKATKDLIFLQWSEVINRVLEKMENQNVVGIGIAMPGPFNYEEGIALFETNDKYEALYKVSVLQEFSKFLKIPNLPIRFLNDASSFGIGGALQQKLNTGNKVLALTLGTGFGAAFLKNLVPIVKDEDVPDGGCLWDKKYKDGVADDYFSTRWFVKRYTELSGKDGIKGVKEIVSANDSHTSRVFTEFSQNLGEFLAPYVNKFEPDNLIIGGNIAKAHPLFLQAVLETIKDDSASMPVAIIENTEEAGIVGSSYLFHPEFWMKMRKEKM